MLAAARMPTALRPRLVRLWWWLGLTTGIACVYPPDQTAGPALSAEEDAATLRARMVSTQIESRGVRDSRVLAAMRKVPRHLFVPEALREHAYDDSPLPIGLGQTISQPYIVAYMTEVLGIEPSHRVLEIGTGSGYQAAILGELAREVYTVELLADLATRAEATLRSLGYAAVKVRTGDGYEGWAEHAPFDRIMVTAAPDEVPKALVDQLRDGGRMVIPVGTGEQYIRILTRRGGRVSEETTLAVRFVPLVRPKRD
jgi:protein-L-isoaspartate(D-aspartate) O-methyltransferase